MGAMLEQNLLCSARQHLHTLSLLAEHSPLAWYLTHPWGFNVLHAIAITQDWACLEHLLYHEDTQDIDLAFLLHEPDAWGRSACFYVQTPYPSLWQELQNRYQSLKLSLVRSPDPLRRLAWNRHQAENLLALPSYDFDFWAHHPQWLPSMCSALSAEQLEFWLNHCDHKGQTFWDMCVQRLDEQSMVDTFDHLLCLGLDLEQQMMACLIPLHAFGPAFQYQDSTSFSRLCIAISFWVHRGASYPMLDYMLTHRHEGRPSLLSCYPEPFATLVMEHLKASVQPYLDVVVEQGIAANDKEEQAFEPFQADDVTRQQWHDVFDEVIRTRHHTRLHSLTLQSLGRFSSQEAYLHTLLQHPYAGAPNALTALWRSLGENLIPALIEPLLTQREPWSALCVLKTVVDFDPDRSLWHALIVHGCADLLVQMLAKADASFCARLCDIRDAFGQNTAIYAVRHHAEDLLAYLVASMEKEDALDFYSAMDDQGLCSLQWIFHLPVTQAQQALAPLLSCFDKHRTQLWEALGPHERDGIWHAASMPLQKVLNAWAHPHTHKKSYQQWIEQHFHRNHALQEHTNVLEIFTESPAWVFEILQGQQWDDWDNLLSALSTDEKAQKLFFSLSDSEGRTAAHYIALSYHHYLLDTVHAWALQASIPRETLVTWLHRPDRYGRSAAQIWPESYEKLCGPRLKAHVIKPASQEPVSKIPSLQAYRLKKRLMAKPS